MRTVLHKAVTVPALFARPGVRSLGPVLLAKLEAARRIDDDDYDWTLNDAP